jgi:transcriptional regulator with XRE-family HTH domain
MARKTKDPFKVFLHHLLQKKGRGGQSKLARKVGISQQYVNLLADIKGDRTGSEKVRRQIAAAFGYKYETFLDKGQTIINPTKKRKKVPESIYRLELAENFRDADRAVRINKYLSKLESIDTNSVDEVEKYVRFRITEAKRKSKEDAE